MLEGEGGDAALGGSVVGSAAASSPAQASLSHGSDHDLTWSPRRSARRSAQPAAPAKRARGGQGLRQAQGMLPKEPASCEYYEGNI